MASGIAKDYTDQVMNTQYSQIMYGDNGGTPTISISSETFTARSRSRESATRTRSRESTTSAVLLSQPPEDPTSASSYTLASDDSQYSNDVDLWIRGNHTESTGIQGSRVATVQRSTLAPSTSLDANGVWYLMAVLLPLFSVNNCVQWRCTPSTVLSAAEIFLAHLSRFCGQARAQIRRLAQDQIARDLFATAMDIVLVVYAIGFLVLSLYQASIIG